MFEWIIGFLVLALFFGVRLWFWALSFTIGTLGSAYGTMLNPNESQFIWALLSALSTCICAWVVWFIVEVGASG